MKLQLIGFCFPQVRTLKLYMSLSMVHPNSERILYIGFPAAVQRAPNPLMCIQISLDCHIRDFSDIFLCAPSGSKLRSQASTYFGNEYNVLGYGATYYGRSLRKIRKNALLLSSGLKSKPSKQDLCLAYILLWPPWETRFSQICCRSFINIWM
jgi:hypothetical protein